MAKVTVKRSVYASLDAGDYVFLLNYKNAEYEHETILSRVQDDYDRLKGIAERSAAVTKTLTLMLGAMGPKEVEWKKKQVGLYRRQNEGRDTMLRMYEADFAAIGEVLNLNKHEQSRNDILRRIELIKMSEPHDV